MSFNRDDSPGLLLAEVDDTLSDTPSEEEVDEDELEDEADESSDDDGQGNGVSAIQSGNVGGQVGAGGGQAAVTGPGFSNTVGQGASVIPVNQNWVLNQPMATPLSFHVTSDANGGVETRILAGNVNFADRNSIYFANNYIRQVRARARRANGLLPLRPNRILRTLTSAQHNWLLNDYHVYAAANNNRRIPNPELTRRFNTRFQENPPRSDLSISGYVSRQSDINAVKYSYTR